MNRYRENRRAVRSGLTAVAVLALAAGAGLGAAASGPQAADWLPLAILAALLLPVAAGYVLRRIERALLQPLAALTLGAEALAAGDDAAPPPALAALAGELRALREGRVRDAARRAELEAALAAGESRLAAAEAGIVASGRAAALRNDMNDLLHSCVGLDEAGAVIARFMPQLLPAISGGAYLHAAGGTLAALARWGEAPPTAAIALADCWALRRGRPHLSFDDADALRCAHAALPAGGETLCVPLLAQGESIGLLHLVRPARGTAALDHALAEALAGQIAMALAGLALRRTLREQSLRDVLTGIHNRRYLEESLDREIARAARVGDALSVFMIDVDHFKRFNDDFGHEAGDAVLRALGGVLRESARSGDLVCRFGGEEFTVVLPGAGADEAAAWGERLLAQVRRMEASAGEHALPGITISLGLAVFPLHGGNRESLLQAADLALYDAKHGGRDRLEVCGK